MKFNKIAKRFAVAALAGVLAVSSMGISAAAEATPTPITEITVGKVVKTDGNTYAPATTFEVLVSTGEAVASLDDGTQKVVVYAGEPGGLTVSTTDGTITSNPAADGLGTSGTITLADTATLVVNASVFEETGVYHYVVTEKNKTNTEGYTEYEGITYDTNSYDVYLYVYQNSTTGDYYVGNYIVYSGTTKLSALNFTNNYGQETIPGDPEDPNNTTHDITVTKSVTGSMADKNKTFDFSVSVTGASGEVYKVVYSVDGTSEVPTSVTSGAAATTITIKNGGYIKVYGLTKTDEVTIFEKDYTSDGYTTTYGDSDNTDGSVESGRTVDADNTKVTVTNTKDTTTPTGIALTIAPYVLMVALAAVVAVVFLRKRSYEA